MSKSTTGWELLDIMTYKDVALSDCPEIAPEKFVKAVVTRALPIVFH